MSSRQLEDMNEREGNSAIARALGITLGELEAQEWTYDPNVSDDGLIYGYVISFGENSDSEVLDKIDGLRDRRWVSIGDIFSE